VPRHPSPVTSLQLLVLHTQRKLTLNESDFENMFDEVLDALEKANDEKFRCTENPETPVSPASVPGVDGVLED